MKFKQRKSKGQRGYNSHGWGSKKKHRGAGHRGGRGMAGTGKRADTKKPTIINLYGNDYYGKTGFKRPNSTPDCIINLRELNQMVESGLVKDEINLTNLGYDKLLGLGKLNHKLKITVAKASKKVIEKLKESGSEVITQQNVTA
tara:strand:+ start:3629 stop:4060 length:432 start_codon:yes stop_codon:yes gene_type:complete